jgi:hypothetical protein
MWKLKGIGRNTDKGSCPLCLSTADVKQISLDYLETGNCKMKFLNEKWLNVNKEVAYRKILRCTNKDQVRNVGRY